MAFEFDLVTNGTPEHPNIIKVIGVGGGGGNAVNSMFNMGIQGVDFLVCNTDRLALDKSPVPNRIQLGNGVTAGLGAGAKPEKGREAALESQDDLRRILRENTRMCFVVAGMGGGTGTGAAPVVAGMAKEMGILTVGIVTTPFSFEGPHRANTALAGIEAMRDQVDTLLIISNQNLMKLATRGLRQKEAFRMVDNVVANAAKGIAEIISEYGDVNVDFADVETIMKDSGNALMGIGMAAGEDRAELAIHQALTSPLLDNVDIQGSTGLLINIATAEEGLEIMETERICELAREATGPDTHLIFGTTEDAELGDQLRVTVVATGFERPAPNLDMPAPKPRATKTVTPVPTANRPAGNRRRPVPTAQEAELDAHDNEELTEGLQEPLNEPQDEPRRMKRVRLLRDERTLAERLRQIQDKAYDYSIQENLRNLEDQPAYVRMGYTLPLEPKMPAQARSQTSIVQDGDQVYLRENRHLFNQRD